MNLKDKIEQANKAYRLGNSIISDKEYDDLLDQYKATISSKEFEIFINSLNEGIIEYGKKVKHPYVMGSLSKLKYETPDEVKEFIKKNCHYLNISAKIDGISCRLHYENGKLISASTRGDGYEGTDLADKIDFVKFVPKRLGNGKLTEKYKSIDIRGELVILKDDFAKMSGFANARNACAGIMNRKDFNTEDIMNVSFIAYAILGKEFDKEEQFALLKAWGFNTAWNETFRPYYFKDKKLDVVEELFKYASQNFEYDTDGLVICDGHYKNEDKYRPDFCKAFKINQLIAETKVVNVVFEGPSKNGVFVPVAVLDPVELGGATISRCSLYNLDFIETMNIKYGSKVKIVRSGDVIPKLVEVIENDSHCRSIDIPTECICCGSKLVKDGINMRCINKDCPEQVVHRLVNFIKKLGVKSASNATLTNFGITSFEKLIEFVPNKKYKSQVKLYDELYAKVFSQSKEKIFCAMNFVGLSEISLGKIVDHYGIDAIENDDFTTNVKTTSLPAGIGKLIMDAFLDSRQDALNKMNMVINDTRWHYIPENLDATKAKTKIKGSICVTGSLKFGSRDKFLDFAKNHGYESKSGVSKGLTYLINNDVNSNSSKNRKAKELGIKILSEDDFMKILVDSTIEKTSLFEL